ncbi:MAG: sterol desaturase family protein [Chitinophagales bacterium]|nr:sterol desaturase family protein [Chitinophagales bacterium]
MQAYANALLIGIPFFLVLILIEAIADWKTGKKRLNAFDTISSLSSGITNVIKDSLGLIFIIVSYPFLLKHLAIFELSSSVAVYLIAFIAIDFAGYCSHRLAHSVNYFWNGHLVHHSSEEFNLPCALRQSISEFFSIFSLFLIPAAIVGVPHEVIIVIAPIQLFMQFWYHTQYIGKLGWLEYIIITPSQHRVHHAINPIYLDKNLGQIFSVWDRLFGTFQEELDEVKPVYGITRPVKTWNPIRINFLHLILLAKDAWRTNSYWDKLRIWFMPVGWRPSDVENNYPVYKIEDEYHFAKYVTRATRGMKIWVWVQFFATVAFLFHMLMNFGDLGSSNLLIYGAVIFAGIYSFTSLMDESRWAALWEAIRSGAGITLILITGDWFGLSASIPYGQYAILLFFITSIIGSIYFALNLSRNRSASTPGIPTA